MYVYTWQQRQRIKKKRGQTIHTVHLTKCTDHLLCSALVLCMLHAGRTSNHLHGANSSHLSSIIFYLFHPSHFLLSIVTTSIICVFCLTGTVNLNITMGKKGSQN